MKLYLIFNLLKYFKLHKPSKSIIAKNKENLKKLINREIFFHGENCDLNHIDVSNITDMRELFHRSQFNGDISRWNVSKVEDMYCMFLNSKFNGVISKWNISHVTNMSGLFFQSKFNQDISQWDVSNVTDMYSMFQNSKFKGDLSSWKPLELQEKRALRNIVWKKIFFKKRPSKSLVKPSFFVDFNFFF